MKRVYMTHTHKKKGSKRKFRKINKNRTQNRGKKNRTKKRGGDNWQTEKHKLRIQRLMELMPHRQNQAKSLKRAFHSMSIEDIEKMTPEEREMVYNEWRNIEAENRKRLRMKKRMSAQEESSTENPIKMEDEDEDFPEVYYEDEIIPYDPYNPEDPKNDLKDMQDWEVNPRKKAKKRVSAPTKATVQNDTLPLWDWSEQTEAAIHPPENLMEEEIDGEIPELPEYEVPHEMDEENMTLDWVNETENK